MNGDGPKFDWRQAAVTVIVVLAATAVQWGVMSQQVTDHARRLDVLEHEVNDRFIGRPEYDRRHDDLIRQIEAIRENVRDLERRQNAGK